MAQPLTKICAVCDREFSVVRKRGKPPRRCPDCIAADPPWHRSRGTNATSIPATHRFTEGDLKILAFIEETLGVSRAEAIRTSIRVYHAILLQAQRK